MSKKTDKIQRVGKTTFEDHADLNCDRQLFITLSEKAVSNKKLSWIQFENVPKSTDDIRGRNILERQRHPAHATLVKRLGSEYEASIYQTLNRLNTRYRKKSGKDIVIANFHPKGVAKTLLRGDYLKKLVQRGIDNEIVLLEHEYTVPENFSNNIFDLPFESSRPDILCFRSITSLSTPIISYLNREGREVKKNKDEINQKIGISVVDIKAVYDSRIGNKYFNGIHYYMQTLNTFLQENKLENDYIILTTGNGILTKKEDFFLISLEDLEDEIVELDYGATKILYENTMQKVIQLKQQIPAYRIDIDGTLTPKCEKCLYMDDCLQQCGFDNSRDENQWNMNRAKVDLLPNTSKSTIEQLKDEGMPTIAALNSRATDMTLSDDPMPMNKELPLLRLHSKAITEGKAVQASSNDIYSVAIPKYSRINIAITAESDSTTERVFAFGIFLGVTLATSSQVDYKDKYQKWWQIWKEYLDNVGLEIDKDAKELLKEVYKKISNSIDISIQNSEMMSFAKGLHAFSSAELGPNRSMEILLQGDKDSRDKPMETTVARARFAYVGINNSLEHDREAAFASNVVEMMAHVVRMTIIMEKYIQVTEEGKSKGINSAVYYWAPEVVNKLRTLMERHFLTLIHHSERQRDMEFITQWINPSNQVADPNQLRKIYDLSKFFRTTYGLALPVNYTWHKVAQTVIPYVGRAHRGFWSDLFNNMDRNKWHDFLRSIADNDMSESVKRHDDIQTQVFNKIYRIYLMVVNIQIRNDVQNLISKSTWPIQTKEKLQSILPNSFHLISKIWFLFASITEVTATLMSNELRTIYPEYSVGKLDAAFVDNIKIRLDKRKKNERSDKYIYTFRLIGLSRHVKIKENDFMLLLPEGMRDRVSERNQWSWQMQIEDVSWDTNTNSLLVSTKRTGTNLLKNLKKMNIILDNFDEINSMAQWYLYPTSMGTWANKLYNPRNRDNSLMVRNNLGGSWLGGRLAFLWEIYGKSSMKTTANMEFSTPETYLYAADLIDKIPFSVAEKLMTTVEPKPDPSQTQSIIYALSGKLKLIQGPPGTGKSQTIVAIIDEFLQRRKKGNSNCHILVTGFSYNSMNVILQKLPHSKDKVGNPTLAATTQKIYVTSSYREPIKVEGRGDLFKVDHLSRENGRWRYNNIAITPKSPEKLEDYLKGNTVFFSNAHQLYHMGKKTKNELTLSHELPEFDLIIIDEASQLPADYLSAILNHVRSDIVKINFEDPPLSDKIEMGDILKENLQIENPYALRTHVVIVGDSNQLPPIRPIKPPEVLENLLGSSFDYYAKGFGLEPKQLNFNYRSHRIIVDFTRNLGIYNDLIPADTPVSEELIKGDVSIIEEKWVREVMDPNKIISSVVHKKQFDSGVSKTEAHITVELIVAFFRMCNPTTKMQQKLFWQKELGIVAPHNAQGRTIIMMTFNKLIAEGLNKLSEKELMRGLRNTIFSVEKFQGSERTMIIATIGVSAKEQLQAEEEFIYDRNRINVLTSRAKSKLVLICSENFLKYIPRDKERFFDVWISNFLTYDFCDNHTELKIETEGKENTIEFHYREVDEEEI